MIAWQKCPQIDYIRRNVLFRRGGSMIFIGGVGGGGGGAQKIMCPHAHYERQTELTFGRAL